VRAKSSVVMEMARRTGPLVKSGVAMAAKSGDVVETDEEEEGEEEEREEGGKRADM